MGKNRRVICCILVTVLLAGWLSGCGEVTAPVEPDNGPKEDMARQETESDSDEHEDVQQTGGMDEYGFGPVSYDLSELPAMENSLYAEWDGKIYFRQYSDEDISNGGLWAEFTPIAYTEKELMCMEPDGEVVEIGVDYGCGAMFIVAGTLYSQRYLDMDNYEECYRVYSYKLDGSDVAEYDSAKVLAVRGNKIICDAEPGLAYIDALTGQEYVLLDQDAVYLDADEEEIFCFYYPENTEESHDVTLCSLDYEGNLHELKTITGEEYKNCMNQDTNMLEYESQIDIPCFRLVKDDLYFSAGTYAGSGHMYTGGPIYSMKKDGSECKIETVSYERNFYLYDDGVNRSLYFASQDGGTPVGQDGLRRIGLYGEEQEIIPRMPYTPYDEPYVHTISDPEVYPNGDSVLFYPDTSGICYILLTMQESEELAIRTHTDGSITQRIYGIEYLDSKLFFTVVDLAYSQEDSIGWRDGYVRGRTVCYCKDLVSGEIRQLYEY